MANPYYQYSGNFIPGTLGRAEAIAAEFQSVQAGFNFIDVEGVDSGAVNAYVVTTSSGVPNAAIGGYTDGQSILFKPLNTNSGASTINVNGLGVVALLRPLGTPVQAGDVQIGVWTQLTYTTASPGPGWLINFPGIPVTGFSGTVSSSQPTNKVGLTAAAGVSTQVIPIDITFAIDQNIAPTWTNTHTFNGALAGSANATWTGTHTFNGSLAGSAGATWTGNHVFTPAAGIALVINGKSGQNALVVGAFSVATAGNVTIAAPSSGNALTVTGVSGAAAAIFLGADAGSINITSTAVTNNATLALQQVNGATKARIGVDGGQSLLSDSANSDLCIVSAGKAVRIGNTAGGTTSVVFAATGAVSIAAPSSGVALSATGVAGQYIALFTGSSTSGGSRGVQINSGTTGGDDALYIANQGNTHQLMRIFGDGHFALGYNGSGVTISTIAAGNVTIAAPSSGNALTVTGSTAGYAAAFVNNAGGGAVQVTGASGVSALIELAGNGATAGVGSLAVGMSAAGNGAIIQRGTTATLGLGASNATTLVFGANNAGITIAAPAVSNDALSITAAGSGSRALTVRGGSSVATITAYSGANSGTLLQMSSNSYTSVYAFDFADNGLYATGTGVPTLSSNKPGANTGVAEWIQVKIAGSGTYYMPVWS